MFASTEHETRTKTLATLTAPVSGVYQRGKFRCKEQQKRPSVDGARPCASLRGPRLHGRSRGKHRNAHSPARDADADASGVCTSRSAGNAPRPSPPHAPGPRALAHTPAQPRDAPPGAPPPPRPGQAPHGIPAKARPVARSLTRHHTEAMLLGGGSSSPRIKLHSSVRTSL